MPHIAVGRAYYVRREGREGRGERGSEWRGEEVRKGKVGRGEGARGGDQLKYAVQVRTVTPILPDT